MNKLIVVVVTILFCSLVIADDEMDLVQHCFYINKYDDYDYIEIYSPDKRRILIQMDFAEEHGIEPHTIYLEWDAEYERLIHFLHDNNYGF